MNISQSESDRLIDLLFHLQDAGSLGLLPAEPELVAVPLVPGRARAGALEGAARGRPVGDGGGCRVRWGRLWSLWS